MEKKQLAKRMRIWYNIRKPAAVERRRKALRLLKPPFLQNVGFVSVYCTDKTAVLRHGERLPPLSKAAAFGFVVSYPYTIYNPWTENPAHR